MELWRPQGHVQELRGRSSAHRTAGDAARSSHAWSQRPCARLQLPAPARAAAAPCC
eukprot:CAMPEP_0179220266 /NCGR_PEP_ID=MMETSP0797-20121207/5512_1 /TAXON_ID=47934 /ORGANISM="Dinophysis acuminata, Strain DAEP01" /LENGTH=55 /DNA_ID=CAMNT_0020926863 /DNA_START=409 /DNA_END=573 /DNA_ORIENTATION=-